MNNEIKEILDYFENNVANNSIYMLKLDTNEAKLLLDYITNLQESEAYYYGYYKDCKSRIDKARGMIRFIAYNSERPLTITELNKVYNILGGDDNAINSK